MAWPMGGRMISVEVGAVRFNLRVAGVCLNEDRVLVHQAPWEAFASLPGGRIEAMESTEGALRREMREELGCEVAVERLLWVIENFLSMRAPPRMRLASTTSSRSRRLLPPSPHVSLSPVSTRLI